ncbi:MucBP domain-containing protein [Streptococcus pseudopneumoniae]|nr:MucBP domain-containing protein [Streptococcus pseudopneumoniae]
MNSPEKQLKYSIRKVSVGAASVVIGALYLLMGAGIAHAEGVESAREAERTANPTDPGQSGIGEPENKTDLSHTDAAANTYNAPVADNPLVTPESTKPRTRSKRELADGESSDSSNGATGTESEPTSGNEGGSDTADTDSDLLDANRKGDTVKEHQPGVIVPKDGETGGDDKNAHLKFDTPKENLTLEQLWDIVKNMPDDFQNNERSYLRSMNTLGDALRFKNGKVSEDGTGDKLQDGEIRELDSFGGWTAIAGKDGRPGKFVIGKKNADGYFTGWYKKEDGTIEQGGMLGADALDNIFVHEQALDRRFKYMLMLVKGRTRANRDETVSDNSKYDPRAQNERANKNSTEFKNLPFLEKDKYNKYSPGVVGYNGIEKQFTAFSPGFGSRVRVEFVTGYISDINGSKGTYRVVIKTKDTAGQEKTVYDETIHRVAEIVQNENLYKKGLNVELANFQISKFFKDEFKSRVNKIRNEKIKFTPLHRKPRRDYTEEDTKLYNQLEAEATEEAKKQGDIVLNVDQNTMHIKNSAKRDSEWKKTFTHSSQSTTKLSNELNNLLKVADKDTPNTPTWLDSSTPPAKADDRAYRLLTTLIPGAKKITYHVKDDQLEVETEKYTYLAARNGSKEVGIQGSDIEATASAETYNVNPQTFERDNTNTKANNLNHGWARSDSEEFKHFSHFVGVDKGIVRTKVLTDKELSEKIKDAVGPGNSNLGKGGYFSTGDVLLGKDVVSYTVQVFSENNERVGVNPQSHRVQYNLPILADFSVIQDTVEPSRTVVEKIIPKLNIPEEEKKKITEKIKEKKKTSELADLISGNVKVRYVDEQGRLLSLKNDTGIGEKESAGTYITNKKQLIGTSYDVTDKKLSSMTTTDGTYYTFKELAANSESLTGNIVSEGRTVTLVYKESEAPTTATVTANYYKEGTQEKLAESVVKADLAIGSQYTTEAKTIEGKTTTEDKEDRVITRKTTYTLVATPANATGTVPEDGATVNYYYRENVEETVVPKTEDVQERKTVTRTIKYVDKANETTEVGSPVTQTVELTRTNKRNKVTGKVTAGDWSTGTWGSQDSPTVTNYDAPDKATVAEATVTSTTTDTTEVVKYPQATEDVKESKTVTRTIKYIDATDETTEVARPVTQTVELTRTNKRNKVTKVVTEGEWTTGNWDEVVSPEIENYGKPDLPKVSNAEVTADSKGTTILVRYDRLSRPEKPIPEKPEIPSPQEPGAPGEPTPDKPNPQPNPEHPSVPTPNPELPNQETPIPELTPEPGAPKTEIPVSPDPEVPTSETNKREELPNTGTEANATLASAGIMTLLAGLGLGFFKKKEDEK